MKLLRLLLLLSGFYSFSASAFEPFQVKDIRVEGIQRTEPGTIFSYLPIKAGDTLTEDKAAQAVRSLYATGFFKDVRLEAEGNLLVVSVVERPAIADIIFVGQKEFDKDKLRDALKQTGLAQGRIFDRSLLEKAEQELKTQYLSRGKYGVEIATTVTPLERNRVSITFTITEGPVAKIRDINIVGNKVFKEDDLKDLMVLRPPGLLTWYSKNDQYSKQKLEGDLESIRSSYLNQGYLDFLIDSTQVAIAPDKRDIFLTLNITEGDKFTVSDIKFAGELLLPEAQFRKLLKLKKGDVFSREKLQESTKLMVDRLGDEGYAFANINPVPDIDRVKKQVAFTLYVDPGRRVYVRRINISGNTTTRDEVIRREMRQLEGGWYSTDKLKRSKVRIDKLGFFSEVNVDTVNVPGSPDQVDIDVKVVERPTGNLLFGIGYSTAEKVILSGSISQSNLFGTGNAVSLQVNSGQVNKVYALSFTNPYFTDDGVSLGWDIYKRDVDSTSLNGVTPYKTSTEGTGLRTGVPITEYDTINYGLAFEHTNVEIFSTSPPQQVTFVQEFGNNTNALIATAGWSRDGRDSAIYTRSGLLQRLNFEVAVPPAELRYYRSTYKADYWLPIGHENTLQLSGQIGYADGYGGLPLPFYKNFYIGGIGSVRGYETASIGPKDSAGNSLGGQSMLVANVEYYFPMPGLEKDKSVRLSVFTDAGLVSGGPGPPPTSNFEFSETRYSVGVGLSWFSPVGPIKISVAKALNNKFEDRTQFFQFSLGTTF